MSENIKCRWCDTMFNENDIDSVFLTDYLGAVYEFCSEECASSHKQDFSEIYN